MPPPPSRAEPLWRATGWSAGLVALGFLLAVSPVANFDIWSHLRSGTLILARGVVPTADWFSFAAPGREWIDLHWGFQVAVAWLYARGGAPLLIASKATVTAVAILLGLLARRRTWPSEVVVAAWLPGLLALAGRMLVRPETLSLLFFAAFLCVLFHADRRPLLLWLLPPLQALWVNTQGLFVFGPIVLGFFWVDRIVDRGLAARRPADEPAAAREEASSRLGIGTLAAVTAAVAAACLLNPYGVRGALLPLDLIGFLTHADPAFANVLLELEGVGKRIAEGGWGNALGEPVVFAYLSALLLAAASFGGIGRYRRGLAFRLLLLFAFEGLTWLAIRNVNYSGFVAGYVTAWNLGETTESLRGAGARPGPAARLARGARAALAVALAALASLVVTDRLAPLVGRPFGWGETPYWYAHAACEFASRPGMPPRVFVSHLGQAAVCIYHLAPQRRVFLAANFGYSSRARFLDYRTALTAMARGDPSWESILAEFLPARDPRGLTLVLDHRMKLWDAGALLPVSVGLRSDPRWREVFRDPVASVFLRKETAEALGLGEVPPGGAVALPGAPRDDRSRAGATRRRDSD